MMQPLVELYHSQPGMIVGYNGAADENDATEHDAYIILSPRWVSLLPLVMR